MNMKLSLQIEFVFWFFLWFSSSLLEDLILLTDVLREPSDLLKPSTGTFLHPTFLVSQTFGAPDCVPPPELPVFRPTHRQS